MPDDNVPLKVSRFGHHVSGRSLVKSVGGGGSVGVRVVGGREGGRASFLAAAKKCRFGRHMGRRRRQEREQALLIDEGNCSSYRIHCLFRMEHNYLSTSRHLLIFSLMLFRLSTN